VGAAEAPASTRLIFELECLSCGYDAMAPVLRGRYTSPFRFTGKLHSVTVDLSGELIKADESEFRRQMAQQ
jgi:hypothetical protein